MAYLRRLEDASLTQFSPGSALLGDLGWKVQTPLSPPAHEEITRRALGPSNTVTFTVAGRSFTWTLNSAEAAAIIRGNTDIDIKYLRAGQPGIFAVTSFLPSEQRHHALRATAGQSTSDALRDIVRDLREQHAAILSETNSRRRFYRIGGALHLVQDSFSPAHTERLPGSRWCINYIRNFGWGTAPREHEKPSDPRDEIARSPREAALAERASRRYLQIVLKAIHGRTTPNPTASSEAAAEFDRFVGLILRPC